MRYTFEGSTVVTRCKYNYKNRVLTVQFNNGHVARYFNVFVSVFFNFMRAESAGKFINSVIKPNYRCHTR